METTRLSSKGQVIIPKSVREARGWDVGTLFDVEEADDGVLLRPARLFPLSNLSDFAGCLPYSGPARSLEDMAEAIAGEARKQRRK